MKWSSRFQLNLIRFEVVNIASFECRRSPFSSSLHSLYSILLLLRSAPLLVLLEHEYRAGLFVIETGAMGSLQINRRSRALMTLSGLLDI